MRNLGDFVSARQPWILPNQVVGMGNLRDFVPVNNWVLPNAIVATSGGSLPKAPDMPVAAIGAKNLKSAMKHASLGCGCMGCGMGALTGDTIIPQASLPTFLQGDTWITGFPNVYLAGLGLVAVAMFMGGGSSYSRRRRNPTRRSRRRGKQ